MELLVPFLAELSISILSKGTIELVKSAAREKRRRPSGRQMVQQVANAVRDPRCLMAAIKRRDPDLLQNLLELGADCHVNACHQIRLKAFHGSGHLEVAGFTPLMLAALADDPRMVRLLLEYGADIEAECRERDGTRRSAVVLAVFYNRLLGARALLEEGADASSYRTNPGGRSLIYWCRWKGNNRMAALLGHYA